ncbi:glycosyltransferase family 2 protein [Flavobacterium sp. ACAM 123]|jgi:glycosyltransferase involved in cell wall biosynthesis|uniref:glycosyltransferase family 2 protein n=1 Tax=Flavobacterium sp. ACAM 123 TaxID=1189620 RepID=UPI0003023F9F|nr:glycosyltransferase family 2 protein [Flavobacterium sp. ACAM 123]
MTINRNTNGIATSKTFLSALIITRNEEHNIKNVLSDLAFADEIIVVDSFSSDKTAVIAATYKNVKVVQHTFENYAVQRNYAISLATYSWIIFLDADERLTAELKEEIIKTIEHKDSFPAYYCYRTFMFKNTKLRFSGWQTDKIIRLFKKEKAQYDLGKIVHEKLTVTGKTGKLENKLIHYSYRSYSDYKQKMNVYGKLKAVEELNKGTKPTFFHFYFRPLYQFLYQYIIRMGILDGKKGIVICYLNAYSVYIRFQELKRMRLNS